MSRRAGRGMVTSRLWARRAGVEGVDLFTRAPLYGISGSEPLIVALMVGSQQQVRVWGAGILLLVALGHTISCVLLLRAGMTARMGGPGPTARLITMAGVLTAAGLAAGPAAFPGFGTPLEENGLPVGLAVAMLFTGGLTLALSPLLSMGALLAAIAVPAAALAALQASTGSRVQTDWALYLLLVGSLVFTYRSSVWILRVMWEIERGRDVQARLAVAEERLRVARDLHDVLGRNLTLIAVNSELAAQMANRGHAEAADRMLEVRLLAQSSMREVRDVVGGSRNADLDTELAGARSVLRSAGITTRVIGDGAALPTEVQTALGWAVREATTNIIRHAEPTTVRIELDVLTDSPPSTVQLRIENDGVRSGRSERPPPDGHGTGLVGLRDRLTALGGDLSGEHLPDGRFRLEARLPLTGTSNGAATAGGPA